jgi:type IV secretory pathway VirB4 component
MAKQNKLANNKINVSTQQYLDIAEIKDNTVVLKDGTLRAVLMVSSINFALKSEEEQNAVISSYVRFLNNLRFTLQIVIQSRELEIDNYLSYLQEKEKEQTNKLLKMQTGDYIEYIKELTSLGRIMSKRFFVVVPYDPLTDKRKGFFSLLKEALRPATIIKLKEKTFGRYQEMLERRLESVMTGLESMGVSVARLDTQSLIELYYKTYNPETSKNQQLADLDKIKVGDNLK